MPPARPVPGDGVVEAAMALGIQRRPRLVEQPQRRRRREQPGQREPPPLPGGEVAAGHVGEPGDADGRRAPSRLRALDVAGRRRSSPAARRGFSRALSAGLTASSVADVVQPAAVRRRIVPPPPRRPRRAARPPARAARPSAAAGSTCRCRWGRRGPARRPALQPEIEAGEDHAPAAHAAQILSPEGVHGRRPRVVGRLERFTVAV